MYQLFAFLQSKNLKIVVKSSDYLYTFGYIIENTPYFIKLRNENNTIHLIPYSTIVAIGLSNEALTPHVCLLNKLPLKYPPFSWTASKPPNAMVFELIRMQKTLSPETGVFLSLDSTDQIYFKLKDIYEINSVFVFICMESPSDPNYIVPLAIVNESITRLNIDFIQPQ